MRHHEAWITRSSWGCECLRMHFKRVIRPTKVRGRRKKRLDLRLHPQPSFCPSIQLPGTSSLFNDNNFFIRAQCNCVFPQRCDKKVLWCLNSFTLCLGSFFFSSSSLLLLLFEREVVCFSHNLFLTESFPVGDSYFTTSFSEFSFFSSLLFASFRWVAVRISQDHPFPSCVHIFLRGIRRKLLCFPSLLISWLFSTPSSTTLLFPDFFLSTLNCTLLFSFLTYNWEDGVKISWRCVAMLVAFFLPQKLLRESRVRREEGSCKEM